MNTMNIAMNVAMNTLILLMTGIITHVAFSAPTLPSSPLSEIKLKVEKYVDKKNGLTVLLVENHSLPIIAYTTLFKAGSKYESKGITGATHFLEHMMFKGAKKYGPAEFDKVIQGNGGVANAYTSHDNTVYHQTIPAHLLEKVMDIESDRMQNLLLENNAFEKERQVILEERKLRYENSPQGKLYLTIYENVFKGTPYQGSVIGSIEDLKTVSRAEIKKYFQQHYSPDNAILVLVGDFKSEQALALVKKYYGVIPPAAPTAAAVTVATPPSNVEWNLNLQLHGNAKSPLFFVAFPGYKIGEHRGYVLDLLSAIIGLGNSSYLMQKYVFAPKPLLSSVSVVHNSLENAGVFFIMGELLDNVSFDFFRQELDTELKNICSRSLSERALEKAKNQYFISYFDNLKVNLGLSQFLGNFEFYFGDYAHYEKEIAEYAAITLSEVKDLCHEIVEKHPHSYFSIWEKWEERNEKK
ncbi:MAG: insulinase family protein [Oligoflexia bacterium]|nr:insulinase family protein [Oligoflexia bacterium]